MAVRNVTRALLVFALLLFLAALIVLAAPPPALQADTPPPLSPQAAKESQPPHVEVPLELRLKIEPSVLKELTVPSETSLSAKARPQGRYIVHLKPKADLTRVQTMADARQMRQAVVSVLREAAQRSQAALLSYLTTQKDAGHVTAFLPYWIFNGVAVTSDLETLLAVAARPEVESVRADRVHYLPPTVSDKDTVVQTSSVEWNISLIGADRVWNAYGLRGQGIVVANMDTGVDWTHPALQAKYRGYDAANPVAVRHDHNWFDATNTYPASPRDDDGHGTHTMGTIVGSLADGRNQVGVAPEAKWIAVKIFDNEGKAYDSWIHAGFQWIMAPTDLNGQNPDPSLAPDVCSNSWGSTDSADTTFWDDVHAWRSAGIFPVFAIGNEYQGSLDPHAPGTHPDAFAVGATDLHDVIAAWSCRGPSPWNEIKPEVAAPGADVRSTLPGNQYGSNSGTSMATPHVAGVVALILQAQRMYGLAASGGHALPITTTEELITRTARPLPDAASIPNNSYGWGRIDAYQAVASVAQGGTFWGCVTDAASGVGVPGATITMYSRRVGGNAVAWTDGQGYYTFSVAAGTYDVTATQFYYTPRSALDVEVLAHSTTQLDFCLTALPAATVVGRLLETGTGRIVTGTVRTAQRSVQAATDASGYYTLTLPLGPYALEAVPAGTGHRLRRAMLTLDRAGQTVSLDWALDPSPRILLVDADVWANVSQVTYYQQVLETLLYSYDTWAVAGTSREGATIPPTVTLQSYDVVVWSQPQGSPGYIGAWGGLSGYLQTGGRLFISGQDIGYWDANQGYGTAEYARYLHAAYVRDDSGSRDVTVASGTFPPGEGITLTLNLADSAGNQASPSEIAPLDGLASSAFQYTDDGCAGMAVDDCRGKPYRAVYLAFGLEGAGPAAGRTETLRRALDWLLEPPRAYDVGLVLPARQFTGTPGSDVALLFTVMNKGRQPDAYAVTMEGNHWPATVWPSATQGYPITLTASISPCATLSLALRVQIPGGAVLGAMDAFTLSVRSTTHTEVTQAISVRVMAVMPWRELPRMPTARYRLAAAPVDGCSFLAVGGWGPGDAALPVAELYDSRTNTWRAVASKPTPAANMGAAALGGKIYVPGGMQGASTYLSVLEVYDPATNRWTRGADLPHALAGAAVAAAHGRLYAFGGRLGDTEVVSSTLEYDPAARAWTEKAGMPWGPRAYAAAAELDGKVYVTGGWPALNTLECYDPAKDTWTALAPMPTGRQSPGLVAVEHYLYAAGGGDSWTGLSVVERYDPQTDSWTSMPALRSPLRAGTAAAVAAGMVCVVGGAGSAGSESSQEGLAVGTSLAGSDMVVDKGTAAPGEALTYAITLRNPGQRPIPAATALDSIPSHTVFVTGSLTGGASYNASANRIEWQGSVPPQSSQTLSFQVAVGAGLARGTLISNTAAVSDGLCAGTSLLIATTVAASDLSRSTKVVDNAVAEAGDVLSYALQLRNVGELTATCVTLLDPLPAQLIYVPDSVSGGIYNANLKQIEWSGELSPGAGLAYQWTDSDSGGAAYQWIDATRGGMSVPGGGDDVGLGPFDIGFSFGFFGTSYTQFYLSTNGQVLLGAGSSTFSNARIPDPAQPNGFIAPFWDDLVSSPGTMYYQLLGTAPQRRLVIEWSNAGRYGVSGALTFEVVLCEGSNDILMQYNALDGDYSEGSAATVGIESQTGTEGVEYEYNGVGPGYPLHANLAIRFWSVPGHEIRFRARVVPDLPPNTLIRNEALLSSVEQPQVTLTATTRIHPLDLSPCRKSVDKTLAESGDTLAYAIELSNVGPTTATHVSLVDPLPAQVTLVPGSLVGASYNADRRQIEWSGELTPSAPGAYSWVDNDSGGAPYGWMDAINDGIAVTGGGDDASFGPFEVGFPFEFYGVTYNQFYLSTNGLVLFGTGSASYSNSPLPSASQPNSLVAAFWDDLSSPSGSMYYKLAGAEPQRRLIIEWSGVNRLGDSQNLTFEAVLYEGSNQILLQYRQLGDERGAGEEASVGIENQTGTEGIQYEYNGSGPGYPLHSGLAVLFRKQQGSRISFLTRVADGLSLNTLIRNEAQLSVDGRPQAPLTATTWINRVNLADSTLSVDKAEVPAGERLVYTIVVNNTGNVTLPAASLLDPIPDGASYVAHSATGGAIYNELDQRIEWSGSIAPQGSVPISFTVDTPAAVRHNTPLTNTALLDDSAGNVITKEVVTLLQSFDLSTSDQVVPATVYPGDVFTCTVRVKNTGAVSASVALTGVLPSGAALVPGSLWSSSGEYSAAAESWSWQGDVMGRGLVLVRFQLLVGNDVVPGTLLTNTVWIRDPRGEVYARAVTTTVRPRQSRAHQVFLPILVKMNTQ